MSYYFNLLNQRINNLTRLSNQRNRQTQNALNLIRNFAPSQFWKSTAPSNTGSGIKSSNILESFSDKLVGSESGFAVSQSEDGLTIAYSSPYYKPTSNFLGQVTVYSYNGTEWVIKGSSINPVTLGLDLSYNYYFGTCLGLSSDGDKLVVAAGTAPGTVDSFTKTNVGDVFIFSWNGSSWDKEFQFSQDGGSDYENIWNNNIKVAQISIGGACISADGSCVAFGPGLVYTYNGSNWVKKGNTISSSISQAMVSLSNDGSSLAISVGITLSVYDYNIGTSTWIQRGLAFGDPYYLLPSAGTNGPQGPTGYIGAIDISQDGNTVSCCSKLSGNNYAVFVYNWNGTSWVQKGKTIYCPEQLSTSSGNVASFGVTGTKLTQDQNGNTLILIPVYNATNQSAPNSSLSYNSGAVLLYIYNPQTNSWNLKTDILYPPTNAYNYTNKAIYYGSCVSITPYIDSTTNYRIIVGDSQYQPNLSSSYSTFGKMGYAVTYDLANL